MAIGGLGGLILAGLSGYAEQQKQAEQNRIRQQEAQVRQQMFQQYLQTQQDTQAGDKIFNDLVRGGGLSLGRGGLSQPQPIGGSGGGLPDLGASGGGGFSMGPTTRTPGKGYGAGVSSLAMAESPEIQEAVAKKLATTDGVQHWANFNQPLKSALEAAGLPTSGPVSEEQWGQVAPLLKQYESRGGQNIPNYRFDATHTAGGPFQITNQTWRGIGGPEIAARMRGQGGAPQGGGGSDLRAQYDAGLARYGQTEGQYGPGHYNSEQGSGRRPAPETFEQYKARFADQGGSGSTGPAQPAAGAGDEDGGGGGDAGDGATAPMAQIEVTPAEKKEAKQLEVKVAQLVDPMARGKMSLEGLMRTIDKANPNASEHAKRQALEKYYKEFLAPEEQERRREDLQRLRDAATDERQRRLFEQQDKSLDRRQRGADDRADKRTRDQSERDDRKSKEQEALVDKRAQAQGWEVREDKDGTQYRYNRLTGEATDLLGKKHYEPQAAAKVGTRPPSGDALMTDDEAKLAAEQYLAGDRTSIQGWGRGAQGDANRVKIRQQISGLAKEKGWKGADVAQAIAEFEGNKAGQRRLGTLEATLGTGLAEANIFAPMLLDASEKVDRTQFPTVNSILMAAERGTGDESVVRYSVAFNALVGAYSQVLTRNGVPTDKARETARETFNPALSKDQMRAVIDQVMLEIKGANKAPGIVRGEMRERAAPGGGQPGAAPQSSGTPKASVGAVVQGPDGKRYRVLSVTPTGEPDEIEPAQ